MPAPAWVSYVGAVTGIIGTLVAIVSAVATYRRVSRIKALDLRIELRKLEADVELALSSLPALIATAKESRTAMKNAVGTLRTGIMQNWLKEADDDRAAALQIEADFKSSLLDDAGATEDALEARLIEMHRLHARVTAYSDKYKASFAEDEKERAQLRADLRARGLH